MWAVWACGVGKEKAERGPGDTGEGRPRPADGGRKGVFTRGSREVALLSGQWDRCLGSRHSVTEGLPWGAWASDFSPAPAPLPGSPRGPLGARSPPAPAAGEAPVSSPPLAASAQVASLDRCFLPPWPRPLRRHVYVLRGALSDDVFSRRRRAESASSGGRRSSLPVSASSAGPFPKEETAEEWVPVLFRGEHRLHSAVPSQWTRFLPLCLLSPLPPETRNFWDPCRSSTQPS